MITALLLKAGYLVVGAVVGWFAKKFHLSTQVLPGDAEARARVDEQRTPVERPK